MKTTTPKPKRVPPARKVVARKPGPDPLGPRVTKTVNIHAAKTHLSSLVEEAAAGTEVVIAKAGKPVARLVPLVKNNFASTLGIWKGKPSLSDDFDAPLPPEILKAFGVKE